MDFDEFILLTEEQKLRLILSEGIFVDGKVDGYIMINIYSIYKFYCEVRYIPELGWMQKISVYSDVNDLSNYLKFN